MAQRQSIMIDSVLDTASGELVETTLPRARQRAASAPT